MNFFLRPLFLFLLILVGNACEEPVITPKPRAYPKVTFPQRGFSTFTRPDCAMQFQYPAYAKIEQNQYFFGEEAPNECWFNLQFPDFNATLHCSYTPIGGDQRLEELQKQAFKMTDWHNKKASYINENFFENSSGATGMVFDVEGPAASPLQFYLMDSLQQQHFFRGAFYFNSQINTDSLQPMYQFIKADLDRMLETFTWKPTTD